MKCLHCDSTEGVKLEDSRTLYALPDRNRFEKVVEDALFTEREDPNADIPLCRECALDHHEYWTEMWREYYSSQL